MPTYDVLKPSEAVEILQINDDGSVVVSGEFVVWVETLKQEIERLRAKVGEDW